MFRLRIKLYDNNVTVVQCYHNYQKYGISSNRLRNFGSWLQWLASTITPLIPIALVRDSEEGELYASSVQPTVAILARPSTDPTTDKYGLLILFKLISSGHFDKISKSMWSLTEH